MNSLRFNTNWRSLLWIIKNGSMDVDLETPVQYVYLDSSRLSSKSVGKFCRDTWNKYGFDYDPSNCYYIWPISSHSTVDDLVSSINADFPKFAHIVDKSPSDVHGLNFDSENDLNFQ